MSVHLFLWSACAVCGGLGFFNVPAGVNWLCGAVTFAALTQVIPH